MVLFLSPISFSLHWQGRDRKVCRVLWVSAASCVFVFSELAFLFRKWLVWTGISFGFSFCLASLLRESMLFSAPCLSGLKTFFGGAGDSNNNKNNNGYECMAWCLKIVLYSRWLEKPIPQISFHWAVGTEYIKRLFTKAFNQIIHFHCSIWIVHSTIQWLLFI